MSPDLERGDGSARVFLRVSVRGVFGLGLRHIHFGQQNAQLGNILVRQLGTVIHPGENVGMGSDYTLFAKIDGTVKYETYVRKRKIQKRVHILPFEAPAAE